MGLFAHSINTNKALYTKTLNPPQHEATIEEESCMKSPIRRHVNYAFGTSIVALLMKSRQFGTLRAITLMARYQQLAMHRC